MNEVSVINLLDYVECSSKLEYHKNGKLYDSRELVSGYLVSNMFLCVVEEMSKGRVVSVEKLYKQLNIFWDKIRKHVTVPISANDFTILQSYAKRLISYFNSTLEKFEVIASNQIFDYTIGEYVIKVPVSALRSKVSVYSFYVDSTVYMHIDKPPCYTYLGPILSRITKDICKGSSYVQCPIIYRAQLLRPYQSIDNRNVDGPLENILKSMESKLFYPRTSNNCKFCKVKESCRFYEAN